MFIKRSRIRSSFQGSPVSLAALVLSLVDVLTRDQSLPQSAFISRIGSLISPIIRLMGGGAHLSTCLFNRFFAGRLMSSFLDSTRRLFSRPCRSIFIAEDIIFHLIVNDRSCPKKFNTYVPVFFSSKRLQGKPERMVSHRKYTSPRISIESMEEFMGNAVHIDFFR